MTDSITELVKRLRNAVLFVSDVYSTDIGADAAEALTCLSEQLAEVGNLVDAVNAHIAFMEQTGFSLKHLSNVRKAVKAVEDKTAISDGRPCNTDEFLVMLFDEVSDTHDREAAIKDWLEGDWAGAVSGTSMEK